MATTKSNFVYVPYTVLGGSAVVAAPSVKVFSPDAAAAVVLGSGGTLLDKVAASDLSSAGYAKNGAFVAVLAANTAITVALDNTAAAQATATSYAQAGDAAFTTVYEVIYRNLGAGNVVVGAASNPFLFGLGGTTPTFTVPAGGEVRIKYPAGVAVSTAKNIQLDPGSGTPTIAVSIGGA